MKQKAIFTPIDLDTWERKEYFDYFYNNIKCKYTLNANIDITSLLSFCEKRHYKFFPTLLYIIIRGVNKNREFRTSFVDGQLGHWNYVVPAYTIFHEDDKTFSDIWSEYDEKFDSFYQLVCADMEKYKDVKKLKAKENQPANFCSISVVPWLSFTSYSQDTYTESDFLFPLIRAGKYFEENNKILLPFAVFVNHAIADGYHTSKLINDIQELAIDVEMWIDS